jgi:hypothetical protein
MNVTQNYSIPVTRLPLMNSPLIFEPKRPYIQGDKNANLSAAVKPFPDAHATFYTDINLKCITTLTSAVKIDPYRKH